MKTFSMMKVAPQISFLNQLQKQLSLQLTKVLGLEDLLLRGVATHPTQVLLTKMMMNVRKKLNRKSKLMILSLMSVPKHQFRNLEAQQVLCFKMMMQTATMGMTLRPHLVELTIKSALVTKFSEITVLTKTIVIKEKMPKCQSQLLMF